MEIPYQNHFRHDIYKVNGKAMVDLSLSVGLRLTLSAIGV